MLTHLGLSATLGPDDIYESEIRKAKYVYIEGYLWDAEGAKAAFERLGRLPDHRLVDGLLRSRA